jgi:hypothetical protein
MWPSSPSNFQDLRGLYALELVDEQLSVGSERNREMGEWSRRRTFELCAVGFEFAAVAGAGNRLGISLPLRDAAKMRANGGDGVETFRHAHDIYLLVLKERNGMDRIEIGIAGAESRRGLKQDIGRKELIGDRDRTEAGNPESTKRDFI